MIGGMCMSEPNAGTDVLGMRSNAVYDAKRDGFVLNGTKVCTESSALSQRFEFYYNLTFVSSFRCGSPMVH
jgi:isovaleryl-CoA dehydrogenase